MTTNARSISASPRVSRVVATVTALLVAPAGIAAQEAVTPESPLALRVVTLDQEALFLRSEFGQRVQRDLEADRAALAAENRRIESDLIAEERELTVRRNELSAAEFAPLAATFDEKVQRIRREQDLKARGLQEQLERERQRFLEKITPVLRDVLREREAAVVLDSDAVLFAVPGLDITQTAIDAIDASIGSGAEDGPGVPPMLDAGTDRDESADTDP